MSNATHHAENAIALAAAASIAFSDVSQAAFALGFAAVGGIMGGWAGSIIIPAKTVRTNALRFLVNLCLSLASGPALGYQLAHIYPEMPAWSAIMLTAMLIGVLGVVILTIWIPALVKWLFSKYGKQNLDDGSQN